MIVCLPAEDGGEFGIPGTMPGTLLMYVPVLFCPVEPVQLLKLLNEKSALTHVFCAIESLNKKSTTIKMYTFTLIKIIFYY